MPLQQILRAVVGNPDCSLAIFRNQYFERKVDQGHRPGVEPLPFDQRVDPAFALLCRHTNAKG